jgi:hypothetical protein
MYMDFRQSESIKELATALAKAQSEVKGALKDSNNPFFKSKYADLGSVWDAVREPLAKNNLAIVQFPQGDCSLLTILTHSSGEYMSASYTMTPTKKDPQGIGSAITYMRRYALQSVMGVCPEDDDGNQASEKQKTEPVKKNSSATYQAVPSQKKVLMEILAEKSIHEVPVMIEISDYLKNRKVLFDNLEEEVTKYVEGVGL